MGSFRRGQPDCGDIDLLITRDPSKDGKDHTGPSYNSLSPWYPTELKSSGLIKKVFDKLKCLSSPTAPVVVWMLTLDRAVMGIIRHSLTNPEDWNALDVKYVAPCLCRVSFAHHLSLPAKVQWTLRAPGWSHEAYRYSRSTLVSLPSIFTSLLTDSDDLLSGTKCPLPSSSSPWVLSLFIPSPGANACLACSKGNDVKPFPQASGRLDCIDHSFEQYFNRSMRLKARHLGYRLNQRGLFKDVSRGRDGLKLTDGKRVECKTEQDIFALLGVTWKCVALLILSFGISQIDGR